MKWTGDEQASTKVGKLLCISDRIIPVAVIVFTVLCNCGHQLTGQSVDVYGENTFERLVSEGKFVDKSLLANNLLRSRYKAIVLMRPTGWGKSVMTDMLDKFFDLEVNAKTGQPKERSDRKLFANLKISTLPDAISHQGQHPVISINLERVTGSNCSQVVEALKAVVGNVFRRYGYLVDYLSNDDERERFRACSSGRYNATGLNETVTFLQTILHRHFNRTVCVLINQYDAPVIALLAAKTRKHQTEFGTMPQWNVYRQVIESDDYRTALSFISSFLNNTCFGRSDTIEKVFATATYHFRATEWYFELLPNVTRCYTILDKDKEFSEFIGFTEEEVTRQYGGSDLATIRNWFGYNVSGQVVYNPRSIVSVDLSKTSSSSIADSACAQLPIDRKNRLDELILMSDDMQIDMQYFADRKALNKSVGPAPVIEFDFIYSEFVALLIHNGYFNVQLFGSKNCRLSVPNLQMHSLFKRVVSNWTGRRLNVTVDEFRAAAKRLTESDVKYFEQQLNRYIAGIPDDTLLPKKDKYYNGIVRSIAYILEREHDYQFTINDNDLLMVGSYIELTPRRNGTTAIILKHQITLNRNRMNEDVKILLAELRNQTRHDPKLRANQFKRVLTVVVLIWSKEIVVESSLDENN